MRILLFLFCILNFEFCLGQPGSLNLNDGWSFRKAGDSKWYKAEVPGTVHTDLLSHKLIPDPYYRDNESKVQWVEKETWEYRKSFTVNPELLKKKFIELVFDGLDTYATVFLNGKKILTADNMFRQWTVNVNGLIQKNNLLVISFEPAAKIAKAKKKASEIPYPDNERVFVRKAQYQFGWDWGPRLVTCGIWKDVHLELSDDARRGGKRSQSWNVRLERKKDSLGVSFQFIRDGKPIFIKGANWIPSDNFLPRAKKLKRYEQLIKDAKEANINMLRVWGGGVYEDDLFYELCDKYGIMVWQDFMFAGALYPADASFLNNVEQEVRDQVKRLRSHPCIVIWCGNNEIEEAWFNWGWQKQFNYSKADSLKLWNDYKMIFHELIPSVLKELDPQRPYWPSSPSLGWGRDSAYLKGDVHYWGVWWGKEPVEKYFEKVGRFNSEYGMQGMPDMKTIMQFALPQDLDTSSKVMRTHQKHPFGYENIKMYIENKFRTPKTFEDLVYVSQLMQADAIRTAIVAHRSSPKTSGTLFWQWNDCWPVTSWSAVDYYGRKKALYYEVKRLFNPLFLYAEKQWGGGFWMKADVADLDPTELLFDVKAYYFNGDPGLQLAKPKPLTEWDNNHIVYMPAQVISPDYNRQFNVLRILKNDSTLISFILLYALPKDLELEKPTIQVALRKNEIVLSTNKFAYGVYISVADGVELEDNYFHLIPGEKKKIRFTSKIPFEKIKASIKIKSLVDTYTK